MRLKCQTRRMLVGSPNHSSNFNKNYSILLSLRVRRGLATRDTDTISISRISCRKEDRRTTPATVQRTQNAGWKVFKGAAANKSSEDLEGFQQKKVKRRTFKYGHLVLAVKKSIIMTHKTKWKFEPNWEGPYVIETAYSNGVYSPINQDGNKMMMSINSRFLKS